LLHVQVHHLERVGELAPWVDDVAHQGREDLVRLVDVLGLDLVEGADLGIEGGRPELLRVSSAAGTHSVRFAC
jgi:hypothetical protein